LAGAASREDSFKLKNTGSKPYELFSSAAHAHQPGSQNPLYGAVPYLTALSPIYSSSVAWVNSAHTWVTIRDMN